MLVTTHGTVAVPGSSANVRSGSERVVRKAHFTMFTDWGVLIQLLCFHYTATAFSKALSVTVI